MTDANKNSQIGNDQLDNDTFEKEIFGEWGTPDNVPPSEIAGDLEPDQPGQINKVQRPPKEREKNDSSPPIAPAHSGTAPGRTGFLKRLKTSKHSRIGLVFLLLVVLAGSAGLYWKRDLLRFNRNPGVIRRAIVIPSYQEQLKFLILADSDTTKSLVSMAIKFEFHSANAPEKFNNERVLIKDAVYLFFRQSQTVRSSKTYWENIVANDLYSNLRTRFPHSSIASIQLAQLEIL